MEDGSTVAAANRVLVIDDDPGVAAVIGRIARRSGYDVIVTADPVDFRQRVRSWRPGIIILDLAMPETDGVELLRYLADERVTSRILIVSGFDRKVLEAAQHLGEVRGLNMAGVLPKPVRVGPLTEALKNIGQDVSVITAPRLLEGLLGEELYLEFQPKIDLKSMRPIGVEALVRWNHPEFGRVPPLEFIPIAEESDLIHRLTEWVLETALRQHKAWSALGLPLTVAVNLSPRNIADYDLTELITAACARTGVSPGSLILEITESAAMGDVDKSMDILTRLRLKGIGLAIDDFGTGYSSLVQLQRLPFSEVKIDKSFVIDCATSQDNAVIVGAIIGLAHRLGLRAVAEGIESREALRLLAEADCDAAQGFLFARPLPAEEIPGWFRSYSGAGE